MSGLQSLFHSRPWLAPALLLLPFLLCGLAMIPYPGPHNDELFFSGPIYQPDAAWYTAEIGSARIPLMVMSYTGALKTWIYQALLYFFIPNKWSLRLPVLFMGLGTLWLTWLFTRRAAGRAAGLTTLALLTADSTFLMTNTFDWGPVALQHLLLMAGLVAVQRWLISGSSKLLALGFFLWGLGMWDKALMAWPLGGMAVAALVVWPRQTLARCRLQALGLAAVSFLVGASPLVWFNVARPGETATQNARFTSKAIPLKLIALREGIEGSTLWGYMVNDRAALNRRAPRTALERTYAAIARATGVHYANWMVAAWLLGLACMALLIGSPEWKLLSFLAVATAVAWVQMAFNAGTGGAPHHVVLLWPFPAIFLGVAWMAVADRVGPAALRIGAVVVGLFCASNLLNVNEYLYNLSTAGATGVWSDAIDRLSKVLPEDGKTWVGAVDWGILNGVRWLHDGRVQVFIASDQLAGPMDDQKRKEFREMIEAPDRLFVRHTDDKQAFPAINEKFRAAAEAAGFRERIERIVTDSNDRPVFVLFRLVRAENAR
jgi:hypothetical protein